MSWRDRLIDPRSPDRRPRRAAYALPTLFTAGNTFLGFYAVLEVFQGALQMLGDASADVVPCHHRAPSRADGVEEAYEPGAQAGDRGLCYREFAA